MPKYKKPQSEDAASGGEVSNISQEHNLTVALYIWRGDVEQEICFELQILNFRNCSAALNLPIMSECVIWNIEKQWMN